MKAIKCKISTYVFGHIRNNIDRMTRTKIYKGIEGDRIQSIKHSVIDSLL